jgi:hypothetical protein
LSQYATIKTCHLDPQPSHIRRKVLRHCLPHAVGVFRRQVRSLFREHSLLSQVFMSAAFLVHVVTDNAIFVVFTVFTPSNQRHVA